jgi:Family of unknown function (DUF5995)
MTQDSSDISQVNEGLVQAISTSVTNTIDEVITLMRSLNNLLPNDDGLKWFNLLYLRMTESIRSNLLTEGWENPQFLERLAVVFAGLYFSAVASWQRDHSNVTRSSAPLFVSRYRQGIVRVQFAIAGMNGHINHDLPIALVQTSEEQGIVPRRDTPEHRDFEKVNTIIETVAEEVKQFLATGIVGEIDQDLGRLDDVVALWSVRKARETAWTNAEILWELRGIPALRDAFLTNLDRLVGLATKGLLIPVG